MPVENVSEEFKKFFLLQFTKELIRHSLKTDTVIEIAEEDKKDTIKEKVKDVLKKESSAKKQELSEDSIKMGFEPSIMDRPEPRIGRQFAPLAQQRPQRQMPVRKPMMKQPPQRMPVLKPLRIPEPALPSRLQYLKPTPTNKEIDLGKLNSLIKDPAVRAIQCDGADKNVAVIGTMGIKKTNIIMSKEDIDEILDKFSTAAKIPLQDEGIFRVVFGRLILSAILSKVISSRFIIRKMMYSSQFQGRGRMPGKIPMQTKPPRPDEIIPRGVI